MNVSCLSSTEHMGVGHQVYEVEVSDKSIRYAYCPGSGRLLGRFTDGDGRWIRWNATASIGAGLSGRLPGVAGRYANIAMAR